ncbi:hypothetical protein [Actinomadura livida]|uniref:LapA family protein n=1 Tax=Actinomadura livida TaxID=79909 RepID=A0A7W7I7H5_9ACTN|nr:MULTISPECIES: hypothetical protein [Actinomadura]MBB4771956.1 hypothetical protein [Actinomadura catellatispora]GGU03663.1 hypothetical protein GCM10010208_29800 [Actinomadura livida]
MVFLGFLLVAAAILAGVGVALDNAEAANLVLFGQTVPGVNEQWQVFLAGAAVALVFCCGMTLTFTGAARRIRTRRDMRDLREEHEESLTALVAEKRRLERELAQVRQGPGAARPGPGAPRPAGDTGPMPRREPAAAAPGVRVAPKNPGASPFFSRND